MAIQKLNAKLFYRFTSQETFKPEGEYLVQQFTCN
jgi:hypothetical protein